MSKPNRFIVVFLADEHAGSKLGLCNPDTIIRYKEVEEDENGHPHLIVKERPVGIVSSVQSLIWNKYLNSIDRFVELAGDDDIFIIKLGELCEGTYYANSSMDLKKDHQVQIAVWNMTPWLSVKNVRMVRVCPGDRAHEFDEGSAAKIVTNILANQFDDVSLASHGLLDIGGFTIDYAHRGPGAGSRKWLEGNNARYYLTDYMMREQIEFGRRPADLVARAHYHEPVFEQRYLRYHDGLIKSSLLVCPALKFPDAYAKTVTQNRFSAAVGTTAVEIVDNKILDIHPQFTVVDTRTWEVYDG